VTGKSVVVEADGGSRGNPGPAGFGAVVVEPSTGAVLAQRSEFIGVATNNVAEYRGLIAGLTAAQELGATQVAVRMDSKLVVEQMSGRWQVKHPDLRALAREAYDLRAGFEAISFEWIPRELNKEADRLANEAMDAAAGVVRSRAPVARNTVVTVENLARRVRALAFLRGEFTHRSGQVSDEYFDKYLMEADPALLSDAARAMADLVPSGDVLLAGLELGGVPLVTMLGQVTRRPTRFVRKRAHDYGTRQLIEGGPVAGASVVLVEDVVTTGGAVAAAVEAVRTAGGEVNTAVCFLDRDEGGPAALAAVGVALRAVLTEADLRT
jgi:orotate phosphoribosyltransferase